MNGRSTPNKADGQRHFRRGVHPTSVARLLLSVPWLVLSLCVIAIVVLLISPENTTALFAAWAVFVLSGLLVFFRPAEYVIARVIFRCRRPTLREAPLLEKCWRQVTESAGVNSEKYQLWVEPSKEINAYASSGHIVAVTTAALNLAPQHLSAILAHELGHHVGGHGWALLMAYWYSLPGRLVVRVGYWVVSRVYTVGLMVAAGLAGFFGGWAGAWLASLLVGLLARLFPVFLVAVGAMWLYSLHPALLAVFGIPVVLAWFDRFGEKYADRVAAELGFGEPLLEVLYGWLPGDDAERRRRGIKASLMSTHPPVASRIRALEKRLYGRVRVGR